MKASFGSPQLRTLWDHSIRVAEIARNLAELTHVAPPEEACLAGLVHDIGRLVLAALGHSYETSFAALRSRGFCPVEIERRLCGSDHTDIGADLLESWSFPADIVQAVRYHHEPSRSERALSSLLYVAESWVEGDEDVYDPTEHSLALGCLRLTARDLRSMHTGFHPDLSLLRFAKFENGSWSMDRSTSQAAFSAEMSYTWTGYFAEGAIG